MDEEIIADYDVISQYTRRQAIKDGVLIDVSEMASKAGFRFPVAMTVGSFGECVRVVPGAFAALSDQDEKGRLWDVLQVLRYTIRGSESDRVEFAVQVLVDGPNTKTTGQCRAYKIVRLYAICGPGDDPEPVITIMLEGED